MRRRRLCWVDKNALDIKVTATAVRVLVPVGHGETVYFEVTDKDGGQTACPTTLSDAPGVVLKMIPDHQIYPQPPTLKVSVIRLLVVRPGFGKNDGKTTTWVVSDNLLKGA